MNKIWTLHHVHEFDDGCEEYKLIGLFSSKELAESALESVRDQPGFRDLPEGFEISEWTVDRIGWAEGYVTVYPEDDE